MRDSPVRLPPRSPLPSPRSTRSRLRPSVRPPPIHGSAISPTAPLQTAPLPPRDLLLPATRADAFVFLPRSRSAAAWLLPQHHAPPRLLIVVHRRTSTRPHHRRPPPHLAPGATATSPQPVAESIASSLRHPPRATADDGACRLLPRRGHAPPPARRARCLPLHAPLLLGTPRAPHRPQARAPDGPGRGRPPRFLLPGAKA
jgi:hypothetical protein